MITHVAINQGGVIYSLPKPKRHHDVIRMMVDEKGVKPPVSGEQGFLDDTGRFLMRKAAMNHAIRSGQVRNGLSNPHWGLFSEDVW